MVTIPDWLVEFENSMKDKVFNTNEEMAKVAVTISERNVQNNGGGPFGTAIFERNKASGKAKLFAVGSNRVTTLNNSTLHGETVAIQFAEKKLGHFSLRGDANKEYILVTSCEPCAMCLGATFWSGVSEMICSATKDDAESIGFDEGPVYPQSYEKLKQAGIKVTLQVLRQDGAKVLNDYAAKVGIIYN